MFKPSRGGVRPLYLRGYRVGDYDIKLNDPSPELAVKIHDFRVESRKVVGVYGECRIVYENNVQLPAFKVDPSYVWNKVAACVHRFGTKMPRPAAGARDFVDFARFFILFHFDSLQLTELFTTEEWLEHTDYTTLRKKELLALRRETNYVSEKDLVSQSFIKDEVYNEVKQPRAINSPSDRTKAFVGALFHSIDKKTFSTKWFVKGTNPKLWPKMLAELLGDNKVISSDYTSFEAHHDTIYSYVIYFWVLHMCRNVASNNMKRLVARMMLGTNLTKFKGVTAQIVRRLMSGSMWTSSANGMLNLLLSAYLCARSINPVAPPEYLAANIDDYFKGKVEGDDAIYVYTDINPALVTQLGIVYKPDVFDHYTKASFCGVVCDPNSLCVITDPIKAIRKFACLNPTMGTTPKRRAALIRAKSLSMLCVYEKCPILSVLAQRTLQLIGYVNVEWVLSVTDQYNRGILREATKFDWRKELVIDDNTRFIMQEKFGVTVSDQLRIEKSIRESNTLIYNIDLSKFQTKMDFDHSLRFISPYCHEDWCTPEPPQKLQQVVVAIGGDKTSGSTD